MAFFLYLDLFYQPVRNLSNAWEAIQNALAGADRLAELLSEDPELQDTDDGIVLESKAKGGSGY